MISNRFTIDLTISKPPQDVIVIDDDEDDDDDCQIVYSSYDTYPNPSPSQEYLEKLADLYSVTKELTTQSDFHNVMQMFNMVFGTRNERKRG
jgi:hypothetical protein